MEPVAIVLFIATVLMKITAFRDVQTMRKCAGQLLFVDRPRQDLEFSMIDQWGFQSLW